MELKIYIPTDVIEYFLRRRGVEQEKGCVCYECVLTKALCLGVLQQAKAAVIELKRPPGVLLQ